MNRIPINEAASACFDVYHLPDAPTEILKMRIGLLTMAGPWGGAEIHTIQLARTLTERGHKVQVVCLTAKSCEGYGEHAPSKLKSSVIQRPKNRS